MLRKGYAKLKTGKPDHRWTKSVGKRFTHRWQPTQQKAFVAG